MPDLTEKMLVSLNILPKLPKLELNREPLLQPKKPNTEQELKLLISVLKY